MRRTLAVLPLAILAALSLADTTQATTPTKVQTTLIGLPSTAALDTPIPIEVKVTNRGPRVAKGVLVEIGLDKDSGAGADPGLDIGPYDGLKTHISKLGVGRSRTFRFKVTIHSTTPPSEIGTFGASYVGPGAYNIGAGLEIQSPIGARCIGECTKDVGVANITLTTAPS
ncbi:MAG TPA: hypothetical protein VFR48_11460 [Solirubrobacteraceae bacterium]|nr:hypothetical protein [Solirubrobacteraceae bacterium]